MREQKTGHKRAQRLEKAGQGKANVTKQPIWVMGLVMMISGEVGNLAAYGDVGTPAAVVTAVGCVGVVANLFIATIFLGEPFRYRDLLGAFFVVAGVCVISIFKLGNPQPLNRFRLQEYLPAPGAISIYVVYVGGIAVLLSTIKKLGDTHVIFYLLLSSFIGAFTVISAKPVSTFAIRSAEGLFTNSFADELAESVLLRDGVTANVSTQALCDALAPGFPNGDGVRWEAVWPEHAALFDDRTNACYFIGKQGLTEPWFYISIVVLILTAVTQVKYLNDALARFDNSEVIPTHYVCFTLLSVIGSTVIYQEWHVPSNAVTGCPESWQPHIFLDGIACTILGVYFITTMRGKQPGEGGDDDDDASRAFTSMADGAKSADEETDKATPLPPKSVAATASQLTSASSAEIAVSLDAAPPTPPRPTSSMNMSMSPSVATDELTPLSDKSSQGGSDLALQAVKRQNTRAREIALGINSGRDEDSIRSGGGESPRDTSTRLPSAEGTEGAKLSANSSRESFVDQMFKKAPELNPIPRISGLSARAPGDRQSRTSNYMALFAGPMAASTFMFDPEDRCASARCGREARSAASVTPLTLFASLRACLVCVRLCRRRPQAKGRGACAELMA